MSEDDGAGQKKDSGQKVAAGAILGVGIGAAIGSATGDLATGIWIGAVIGVGAAFAWNAASG